MRVIKIKFLALMLLGMIYTQSFGFSVDPEKASGPTDDELIKEAILDYVEGVYNADTARIYRSVHPTLVKRGAWFDAQKNDYVPLQEMSFQQLVNLTKRWNKDGSRADAGSIKDIVVYDVQDKTAAAKLTAVWGTDYFHLAKLDGRWYIINVLWQSPPKS